LIITIIKGGDVMSDAMILLKGTLKVIKYFFPVVVVFIFGLACIYIDERRDKCLLQRDNEYTQFAYRRKSFSV